MKNKILFGAILFGLCFIIQNANAQLKVKNSGRVMIDNNLYVAPSSVSDTAPAVTVTSTALFTKSAYGVYSKAWYQKNPAGSGSNYNFGNKVLGLYGNTEDNLMMSGQYNPTPPFNAGVAGTSDKGVGVYGAIRDTFPRFNPGHYAGYFLGNTKVVGTLTCTSLTQTSDAITKNNVNYLPKDICRRIMQLKPVSFYYNLDDNLFNPEDTKSPAASQMHYGFMAQELKEVLPDIVYEGQDSILSINYIELIPLLVQAVQELSSKVEELQKSEVANRQQRKSIEQAILYQNKPNPFSIDTNIEYVLPQSTNNAILYIYNMNGLQVAEYPIASFGTGSVVVKAGHLEAGMYLYSLVADGQIVDTKRMILTK